MRAGVLLESIKVLHQVVNKNKYGEDSITWEELIETRAGVSIYASGLGQEVEEIFSKYKLNFTIRYYHNIDETMRIQWKDKLYRITNIVPDRAKQRLLVSTELVNE